MKLNDLFITIATKNRGKIIINRSLIKAVEFFDKEVIISTIIDRDSYYLFTTQEDDDCPSRIISKEEYAKLKKTLEV